MADPEITSVRNRLKWLADHIEAYNHNANIRHDYLMARIEAATALVWGLAFFSIFTLGVAIYALLK